MPAVDTIEALTAAAQAFSAQRLGLQMDPDAEAAVRESLQRTGLVLLGEIHGVAQTPVLVEEMIRMRSSSIHRSGRAPATWPVQVSAEGSSNEGSRCRFTRLSADIHPGSSASLGGGPKVN